VAFFVWVENGCVKWVDGDMEGGRKGDFFKE
jgi:hypothetical protein